MSMASKFHVIPVRLEDGSKVFNVVGFGKDWNNDDCKIVVGATDAFHAQRLAHLMNEHVVFIEVDKA